MLGIYFLAGCGSGMQGSPGCLQRECACYRWVTVHHTCPMYSYHIFTFLRTSHFMQGEKIVSRSLMGFRSKPLCSNRGFATARAPAAGGDCRRGPRWPVHGQIPGGCGAPPDCAGGPRLAGRQGEPFSEPCLPKTHRLTWGADSYLLWRKAGS